MEKMLSGMREEVTNLSSRVETLEKGALDKATPDITELRETIGRMDTSIIDLQCRSMRDNLIFYGIQENKAEDCIELVDCFCARALNIPGVRNHIDRAHRIGPHKFGQNRPIVARFTDFRCREHVRTSSFRLQGTPLGIAEQFPKEITENRKQLFPVLKKAKRDKKKAVLVRDKLFIEGKFYEPVNKVIQPPREGSVTNLHTIKKSATIHHPQEMARVVRTSPPATVH